MPPPRRHAAYFAFMRDAAATRALTAPAFITTLHHAKFESAVLGLLLALCNAVPVPIPLAPIPNDPRAGCGEPLPTHPPPFSHFHTRQPLKSRRMKPVQLL